MDLGAAELGNLTIRQGNTSLEEHIRSCCIRETYISKTTQNILFSCCYDSITEAIIERVNYAQYFSTFCDETSGTSDKE